MAVRYYNPWNPPKRSNKKRNAKKRNPFSTGTTKKVPKGKRSGDVFKSGNRWYMVVSYINKAGKRVRYARPFTGLKPSTKKRGKSRFCPVPSTTSKKTRSRRRCDKLRVKIPKGKRSGDVFTKGDRKFRVVSFVNRHGTRTRYPRQIKK